MNIHKQTHRTLGFGCILIIVISSLGLLQGCYYDNEEELYPQDDQVTCDTSSVSYTQSVLPILETHCLGCHDTQSPAAGIVLEGFSNVLTYVNSGQLEGAITHSPGFEPMPRNANKLPECEILTVQAWINQGAQEN